MNLFKVIHKDYEGIKHGLHFKNGEAIAELAEHVIDELKVIGCKVEEIVKGKQKEEPKPAENDQK
jgi:hypothetical protein